MKKNTFLLVSVLFTTIASAQTLKTEKDSASYALGILNAQNLQKQNNGEISTDSYARGMSDFFFANNKTLIPVDSAMSIMQRYATQLKAQEEKKIQEVCLNNSDFLLKNKENKDVVTLENGLQYKVIEKGKGKQNPTDNDNVTLHYKGSLIDGTVFDSSIERGEPATFPVNAVIPGFSQALKLMTEGAKYIAYIPSDLGYGMNDMGTIKPCSTLIFEIELIKIEDSNDNTTIETIEPISPDKATNDKSKKKSKKEKKD